MNGMVQKRLLRRVEVGGEEMWVCSACKIPKPTSAYGRKGDRLMSRCKPCTNAALAVSREKSLPRVPAETPEEEYCDAMESFRESAEECGTNFRVAMVEAMNLWLKLHGKINVEEAA